MSKADADQTDQTDQYVAETLRNPVYAAAPDLLEALEELITAMSGVDADRLFNAERNARAAIAKAKGAP